MTSRPNIPAAMKREVRQRCGFGCAICGCPVYDYEHIEGYETTGHRVDAITLLCPTHHREKTVGRLPTGAVAEANSNPFNGAGQLVPGHPLYFDPRRQLELRIGSCHFLPHADSPSTVGLAVFGDFALGIGIDPEGRAIVDIDVRDDANRLILRVIRGEMRFARDIWDVEFVGPRLHLRRRLRDTVIDVQLDAPAGLVAVGSANFHLHGVHILAGRQANEGGFELPQTRNSLIGGTFIGSGAAVGEPLPTRTLFAFPSADYIRGPYA